MDNEARRTTQRLPGFVIVVLVLAVVNGCLYVVQEADYKDAIAEAESFEQEMRTRWRGFLATKEQLARLESQIQANKQRVSVLATQIDAMEAEYPSGAPRDVYNRHVGLVDEHNRLIRQTRPLAAEFNAKVESWNAQVDAYNTDVQRYNGLVARIPTSQWYILPGLGRRSGARAPKPTLQPAPVRP